MKAMVRAVRFALVFGLTFFFISCDPVSTWIRNWGERSRRTRIEKLDETEVRKWEADLQISRNQAQKLHEAIEEMVQESDYQGELSRKLARAYMKRGQYEQASRHYSAAMQNRMSDPNQPFGERISKFDEATLYYNESLLRHNVTGELLFEAGLAYANASVDLGWEKERWEMARWLFARAKDRMPDDTRPLYQLALLYGKVVHPELRDEGRAIDLLQRLLEREPNDISARFALGHLYAQSGELDRASNEYKDIQKRLQDLHRSGVLSGSAEKNPIFQKAKENVQKLETCTTGSPGCEILDVK